MNKIFFLFTFSILFFSCKKESKNSMEIIEMEKNNTLELSRVEILKWVEKNMDNVLVKNNFEASNELTMPYGISSPSKVKNKIIKNEI